MCLLLTILQQMRFHFCLHTVQGLLVRSFENLQAPRPQLGRMRDSLQFLIIVTMVFIMTVPRYIITSRFIPEPWMGEPANCRFIETAQFWSKSNYSKSIGLP